MGNFFLFDFYQYHILINNLMKYFNQNHFIFYQSFCQKILLDYNVSYNLQKRYDFYYDVNLLASLVFLICILIAGHLHLNEVYLLNDLFKNVPLFLYNFLYIYKN